MFLSCRGCRKQKGSNRAQSVCGGLRKGGAMQIGGYIASLVPRLCDLFNTALKKGIGGSGDEAIDKDQPNLHVASSQFKS